MGRPNIIPAEQFNDHINSLKKGLKDFTVVRDGTIKEIKYLHKIYKFVQKPDNEQRKTMQACKDVKADINNRKAHIKNVSFSGAVRQMVVDLDNVEQGKEYYWFDIANCYWQLAYNAHIISLDTFAKYIDESEARNIAIGNLGNQFL